MENWSFSKITYIVDQKIFPFSNNWKNSYICILIILFHTHTHTCQHYNIFYYISIKNFIGFLNYVLKRIISIEKVISM